MPDYSPKIIYYKTQEKSELNQLPYFFGWVEFIDEKIEGEHYKPKIDQVTGTYMIGYYKIEGQATDFLQSFEKHGLAEITQEEFNALLSQWTQGGQSTPICWGLGAAWEIAKPSQ